MSNATAPTETSTSSNLTCSNANDGSITTTATGTAPFNFSIDGGVNYIAGTSPFTSTGLPIGTYDISVQDANGCVSIINSITITEPTSVSHTTFDRMLHVVQTTALLLQLQQVELLLILTVLITEEGTNLLEALPD